MGFEDFEGSLRGDRVTTGCPVLQMSLDTNRFDGVELAIEDGVDQLRDVRTGVHQTIPFVAGAADAGSRAVPVVNEMQ